MIYIYIFFILIIPYPNLQVMQYLPCQLVSIISRDDTYFLTWWTVELLETTLSWGWEFALYEYIGMKQVCISPGWTQKRYGTILLVRGTHTQFTLWITSNHMKSCLSFVSCVLLHRKVIWVLFIQGSSEMEFPLSENVEVGQISYLEQKYDQ